MIEEIQIHQPMWRFRDSCWETMYSISYTIAIETKEKLQQKYPGNKITIARGSPRNEVRIYFRNDADEAEFILRESK